MLYVVDALQFLLITLTDLFGKAVAEGIVITIIMIIGPLFIVATPFAAWQVIKALYWISKGVTAREIIGKVWKDAKEAASDMLEMLTFPIFLYIHFAGPILLVCWTTVSFGWWGPIFAAILVTAMIAFVLWPSNDREEGTLLIIWVASFVVCTVIINILGAFLRILIIPFYVLKYASQTIGYMIGKRRH